MRRLGRGATFSLRKHVYFDGWCFGHPHIMYNTHFSLVNYELHEARPLLMVSFAVHRKATCRNMYVVRITSFESFEDNEHLRNEHLLLRLTLPPNLLARKKVPKKLTRYTWTNKACERSWPCERSCTTSVPFYRNKTSCLYSIICRCAKTICLDVWARDKASALMGESCSCVTYQQTPNNF